MSRAARFLVLLFAAALALATSACRPKDAPKEPTDPKEPTVLVAPAPHGALA